jgi:hypothetical protein
MKKYSCWMKTVEKRKKTSLTLNPREYDAFHSLLFGKNVNWEVIFDFSR